MRVGLTTGSPRPLRSTEGDRMTVVDHGFPFLKYVDTRRADAHGDMRINHSSRDMPGQTGVLRHSGAQNRHLRDVAVTKRRTRTVTRCAGPDDASGSRPR